ncbi:hypothetical protein TPADAL_0217a [Treponema pallidum subsp. pallidum DAL-1]|uniref:Uncharacterized protein n=2 Tax=Treponema pallidum TaxID=160 RepID=A0AAU8RV58_TREPL|nr:hypothetical protein TPESAMD_0217a [Treponema pallidum subsp. pertenue str. SamoaD]AEZ58409.1 hypothetical protein TPECDC2_0217a [Treponema pallidum subsp. pertenue str. CDC2]AEZ59477.1 hypothetical protein TPEGAU_0217a [Treponema pallidum subsp. pertenue str. Gauthier]AEZ60541.1 hypothetical protein TPADAL_0217a [Treponema pallidum subsp. pallidum DAL-1]AGK83865.1 hypothetical protein TPFB_0217a [Treponema pallidum str. Fribourg-Blanc]AJB40240.1 hypothetical protein TENDBA_0217a [Treponema
MNFQVSSRLQKGARGVKGLFSRAWCFFLVCRRMSWLHRDGCVCYLSFLPTV